MIDIVAIKLLEMAKEIEDEKSPKQREEEARRLREWKEAERQREEQTEKARRDRLYNMEPTATMRATKTSFRKVIKWSSSRYNLMKKEEVVNEILRLYHAGASGIHTYSCGSYTQSSDMSCAGTYHLVIGTDEAKLVIEDGPVYRLIGRRRREG